MRRTLFAAAALLVLAIPAQAEAVKLVCSIPDTSVVATLDIDLSKGTVCSWESDEPPPCRTESARVTDRFISFGCAAPRNGGCGNPTVLDRSTGIIRWPVGTGTCQRAGKPVL